jgi:hypothetical protein
MQGSSAIGDLGFSHNERLGEPFRLAELAAETNPVRPLLDASGPSVGLAIEESERWRFVSKATDGEA